jgi:nitrite reductase/ring-hydroxylating ferredoxin subunit
MKTPAATLVENVDLVVTRDRESDEELSILYGRCPHRGAMVVDRIVSGKNPMRRVHFWGFRVDAGVSTDNNAEVLAKFTHWVEGDEVLVDADEVAAWHDKHPPQFDRENLSTDDAQMHKLTAVGWAGGGF